MLTDCNKLALQAHTENKYELSNLLSSLGRAIDNNEMPTAKDLLRDQNSSKKIKRPPNSNIIYTNRLNKFGLLEIIRKFCEEYGINKQRLIPLSKKVSKILWNELSDQHKKFFEELASKVSE